MMIISMSLLWNLIGILAAVAAAIYAYLYWSFQYWKRKNVPYIEPVIPWGSLENPLRRTVSPGEDIIRVYNKAKAEDLKYVGIYVMTAPNLILLDLNLVKQVMTKDFDNFMHRGEYINEKDDPLSCHLFAVSGTKWRNLRSKLSPTFTSGKMKSMFTTLVDCGLVLEKYVENNIDNSKGVDIKDILCKFSTDIIGSCAFGIDCNSFKDPNSPFRENGKAFFNKSKWDVFKYILAKSFPTIARRIGVVVVPKDISDFFRKVVADTISYRQKNNLTRNDFLQLLIEIMNKEEEYRGDGKSLTVDETAAQCFAFFIGGFETSSTIMTFALYQMALHQDVQDRVRKEIQTVLGRHDGKMTYDSVNELKYMKQVIDETMRMYSPVPFVTRESAEDYKLPGEDVIIEKGKKVIIPINAIHQDEEYYENPSKFNPERFSEKNKVGRHPYAYIPFGEGPKFCIAKRFGVMQTKVGLTSILRNFKVTLNKKTQHPLKLCTKSFVPTAEDGVWVNLEKIVK